MSDARHDFVNCKPGAVSAGTIIVFRNVEVSATNGRGPDSCQLYAVNESCQSGNRTFVP